MSEDVKISRSSVSTTKQNLALKKINFLATSQVNLLDESTNFLRSPTNSTSLFLPLFLSLSHTQGLDFSFFIYLRYLHIFSS